MNLILIIVLVSFIAFSGQAIGNLLAKISPEEMKPGNKYFKFFEMFFIFIISVLALVLFFKFSFVNVLLIITGIVIGLFFKKIYFWFSGILFSSVFFNSDTKYLFIFSVLIFIYGLFYGTLNRPFLKANKKKFIIDFCLFFIIGSLILLFNWFFSANWVFNLYLFNFFIGGLISQLYLRLKSNA